MKKLLIRTGIITLGSISMLSEPFKVYAGENKTMKVEKYDYSKVLEVKTQSEREEIVIKYAKIYELKEEVVIDKVRSLTNNLMKIENLNEYIECGTGEDGIQNEELLIFYTVRDICRNPKKYDLVSEEITGEVYESEECYEDLLKDACELMEINSSIALAISCHECGADLKSRNFRVNNNPAGLGPHNHYKNIAVAVYEYAIILKDGYHCTKDSDASFFDRIGHIYCQDGSNWSGMVKSFYYNIEEDYYYYAKIYGRTGKVLEKENVK